MTEYHLPTIMTGPGSQPGEEDGAELDIMQLPDEMATFSMPDLPEPEKVAELSAGMQVLEQLQELLESEAPRPVIDLTDLDDANRQLVDQVLGEGEVSAVYNGAFSARIQESVLAGVWRLAYLGESGEVVRDTIEVGSIPTLISANAFKQAQSRVVVDEASIPEGVLNAPPLLAEINEKVAECRPGLPAHVINLTLLPQTEQDLAFLDRCLGQGSVTILSRGYGNCRITSTATEYVWWVQYFNSQDANILNTLEIGGVPEVACAAPEDIRDSAERLGDIMEAYR